MYKKSNYFRSVLNNIERKIEINFYAFYSNKRVKRDLHQQLWLERKRRNFITVCRHSCPTALMEFEVTQLAAVTLQPDWLLANIAVRDRKKRFACLKT